MEMGELFLLQNAPIPLKKFIKVFVRTQWQSEIRANAI